MKTVAIYTLGCKANQADGDMLAAQLQSAGFGVTHYKNPADICIVNTCTVTAKAAYQSRQAVRRFIKKNPAAEIIVTGCDAAFEREALAGIEGVSIANPDKDKILMSFLRKQESSVVTRFKTPDPRSPIVVGDKFRGDDNRVRSRPFLKIQDGCDNPCSYCIVPKVRGGLVSTPEKDIIRTIENYHKDGYYEVVLTGIHIGKYGRDTGSSLHSLLVRILDSTGITRVRLSSIEPDELDGKLIDLAAGSGGRICPHFHIPLQSGCDGTLEKMSRKYTAKQYADIVANVKDSFEYVAIGADVITGFPGEGDKEFRKTCDFISSLPLAYLHAFSYSDRKGTKASFMSGKVPEGVKKERTAMLRALSSRKREAYLKSRLGQKADVVFDKGKRGGVFKGVSEDYICVLLEDTSGEEKHVTVSLDRIIGENIIGGVV